MSQRPKKMNKLSTHMTNLSEETKGSSTRHSKGCFMCSGYHHLWDCSEFQAKPVTERIAFMRQSRLCDNYSKKGYIGRYCRKDGKCTVTGCRWKHHALLNPQQNGSSSPSTSDSQRKDIASSSTPKTVGMTAAIQTNCETNKIFLNVVPVRVSAEGNFVDTLAFWTRDLPLPYAMSACRINLKFVVSRPIIPFLRLTKRRIAVEAEEPECQYLLFRAEIK